jgi:hypothetical protein
LIPGDGGLESEAKGRVLGRWAGHAIEAGGEFGVLADPIGGKGETVPVRAGLEAVQLGFVGDGQLAFGGDVSAGDADDQALAIYRSNQYKKIVTYRILGVSNPIVNKP